VLDDAGVSRRHAEIRPRRDGWTVEDLGSTNGVRVNGRRDPRRAAAAPGRPRRARLDRDRLRSRMTTLEPVSVALKFGFLAVLYLFLLWVARSARRTCVAQATDSARGWIRGAAIPRRDRLYSASALGSADVATARRGSWSSAPPATTPG
jgi:hypothetical protein